MGWDTFEQMSAEFLMAKPLLVTIPHNLGKEEALRRLQAGLGSVKANFAGQLLVRQESWTGDHLDFQVAALKQEVKGTVDVQADAVLLSVELPWVLAVLAEKAKSLISRQGQLMLEKK
jgi:hypothetical protein